MRLTRNLLCAPVCVAAIVFLFSAAARAQGAVSYRFLEVVDYAAKPVAGATVKVEGRCVAGELETDEKGRLEKGLPIGFGDCGTRTFTVSKAGFYPFTDYFNITNSSREPIKLELLIVPETEDARRAVGSEQHKREFFVAARRADIESVRRFLKLGLSANLTTSDLRGVPVERNVPVLVYAAKSGDSETVNEFLAAGAKARDITALLTTYLSASPFARRVYRNETEKRRLLSEFEDGAENLINAGANVHSSDLRTTALIVAAERGYLRTAGLLLEKGVPVDATDAFGATALTRMTMYPNDAKARFEMADLLLKKGARIDFAAPYNESCRTPLMFAAMNADAEMVEFLLARRADVNVACRNGETALKLVKSREQYDKSEAIQETIELLERAGAK